MSISGSFSVDFNFVDTRTIGLATNVRVNQRLNQTLQFVDGTGAGAGNLLYANSRTIPGGGNDDIDLAGVLTDAFGGTITDVRVKGFAIYNPASNAALTVGGGTNPATGLINGTAPIPPDGFVAHGTRDAAGYAVTAGTGDILRVSGTAGQSYQIAFLGGNA